MSPAPGLEVLFQQAAAAAAATVKAMLSKASRVPFEAVLSEKHLDITEPTSTRPLPHRPGGAHFSLRAWPSQPLRSSYRYQVS